MATAAVADPPVISMDVDPDEGSEDDGPVFAWLPPDDRLWRHPSELQNNPLPDRRGASVLRDLEHRVWAMALLAGAIGALLASGAAVIAGSFDRTTTVVRPVERVVDTGGPS